MNYGLSSSDDDYLSTIDALIIDEMIEDASINTSPQRRVDKRIPIDHEVEYYPVRHRCSKLYAKEKIKNIYAGKTIDDTNPRSSKKRKGPQSTYFKKEKKQKLKPDDVMSFPAATENVISRETSKLENLLHDVSHQREMLHKKASCEILTQETLHHEILRQGSRLHRTLQVDNLSHATTREGSVLREILKHEKMLYGTLKQEALRGTMS